MRNTSIIGWLTVIQIKLGGQFTPCLKQLSIKITGNENQKFYETAFKYFCRAKSWTFLLSTYIS